MTSMTEEQVEALEDLAQEATWLIKDIPTWLDAYIATVETDTPMVVRNHLVEIANRYRILLGLFDERTEYLNTRFDVVQGKPDSHQHRFDPMDTRFASVCYACGTFAPGDSPEEIQERYGTQG